MLLIAQNMGKEKCCNQFCLSGMNMTEATNIMLACLQELEKKNNICIKRFSILAGLEIILTKATTNIYGRLDWENFRSQTFVE
jgi:hypothetical protein